MTYQVWETCSGPPHVLKMGEGSPERQGARLQPFGGTARPGSHATGLNSGHPGLLAPGGDRQVNA